MIVRPVCFQLLVASVAVLVASASANAAPQDPSIHSGQHQAPADNPSDGAPAWRFAVDGSVFVTGNFQGGRRGENELVSQNWLMATATRSLAPGTLALSAMFSAEPLTMSSIGYSEIFQTGEASGGLQITDHQHPHDLFMELAAAWRAPITERASVTIAGAPVGEPTLGPVAFMHRPSAAENPSAPLSHHIFDSTHTANSVVLARLDAGIVAAEGSVFHGREPDDRHYDIPLGALDSWAARFWLKPGPWLMQASYGFLHEPEQLEPGDQRRANASVSWLRTRGTDFSSFTVAAGRVERTFSVLDAVLAEATHHVRRISIAGRFEWRTEETEILLFPEIVHRPHPGELVDPIAALTTGAVYDLARWGPLAIGAGGDVTWYRVPPLLQFTHGERPVSFHTFLRIARANPSERMWNMTMGDVHLHGTAHSHRDQ